MLGLGKKKEQAAPADSSHGVASSGGDFTEYRKETAERRAKNPIRGLHHHAYLCRNMEETRKFYEDVVGLPLVGTWIERFNPVTNKPDNYLHTFFELGDGSYLAFFQFKDQAYNDTVAVNHYNNNNPFFHHIALTVEGKDVLEQMMARLKKHNVEYVITDHGYCYSIYFFDPNGMQVEFTTNVPITEEAFATVGKVARETLDDWMAHEDAQGNNALRAKEGWVKG